MTLIMRRTAFGTLTLLAALCTVAAEVQWSKWYNSDKPVYGSGVDDETLKRVAMVFSMPCRPEEVRDVQCRPAGSREEGTWFARQPLYNFNVLYVPCNRTGLVCRNQDQDGMNVSCADYEIRVSCLISDNSQPGGVPNNGDIQENNANSLNPSIYQGDLGSSGGFIAMAAGGSVVLPLICVLFVQLRKSRREERRRADQARQAAEDLAAREAAARTADAPPSYDDLFGGPETVSVISSSSLDSGVALDFQSGGGSAERLANSQLGGGDAEARSRPADHRGPASRVLSSTLSNSSSVSSASSSSSSPIAGTLASSRVPVSTGSDLRVHHTTPPSSSSEVPPPTTSSSTSSSPSLPPASGARRTSTTSSASSVSSVSSSVALLPPSSRGMIRSASSGSARHHVIHHDPPPAYDAVPGRTNGSHLTVVLPGVHETVVDLSESSPPSSSFPSASTPQSPPPPEPSSGGPTRRRFLGMHLSIFDLMAVIYPDPNPSPPPPSYDDALKILNQVPSSSTSSQRSAGGEANVTR